jgi:N-dimethylarginine dimethylaminohydrolase
MSSALQSTRLPRIATACRYLRGAPRYFTVSYVINPWMDPGGHHGAMTQWTALADTYRALGHTVDVIDPEPGRYPPAGIL